MLISIKMRIGIFLCRKAKQTMKLLVWQNINNDELKVIVKALLLHVSFKCPSFTNFSTNQIQSNCSLSLDFSAELINNKNCQKNRIPSN